jgi:hypothetical protein
MKPDEEMNLTVYLQTEGRHRAAELAAAAASRQAQVGSGSSQQTLTAASSTQRQPRSLSEFLQFMGIAPSPYTQRERRTPPDKL